MTAAVTTRKATSLSPSARDVFALVKPRITLMVLLTAAGGIWLSPARASKPTIAFALLGTALIVGGANALNMYIEREIDGFMKRTKDRPESAWAALWSLSSRAWSPSPNSGP